MPLDDGGKGNACNVPLAHRRVQTGRGRRSERDNTDEGDGEAQRQNTHRDRGETGRTKRKRARARARKKISKGRETGTREIETRGTKERETKERGIWTKRTSKLQLRAEAHRTSALRTVCMWADTLASSSQS